jgi:hypothetical protein
MFTYTIKPNNQNDSMKRFLETGALPPEDVKMLGRWHEPTTQKGFILTEAENLTVLGIWSNQWADLISLEVSPVLNDEEMQIALSA